MTQTDLTKKTNPYDLEAQEKALNASASSANALWVTFLSATVYMAIGVGSITHQQLLAESSVKLPVITVDLPLVGFFLVAPVLYVALHFFVLLQLYCVALKCADYDIALRDTLPNQSDRKVMRRRLDTFIFFQAVMGRQDGRWNLVGRLAYLGTWLTLAAGPLLLLLFIQCTFLPYHDETVTWVHRLSLFFDIGLVSVFFVSISKPKSVRLQALDSFGTARKVVSVFFIIISKPHSVRLQGLDSLDEARREVRNEGVPVRQLLMLWRPTFVSTTIAITLVVFSFLVASFPGECVYEYRIKSLSSALLEGRIDSATGQPSTRLSNRLILPDRILIDRDRAAKTFPTISLRGRDLRAAILDRSDLRGADFTGADLSFASLRQTELQGASFGCGRDRSKIIPGERSSITPIANGEAMRPSGVQCARLYGAFLEDAKLQWATFEFADLAGASFIGANLTGASFFAANLRAAWLSEVIAERTTFDLAHLEGAVLNRANLLGASFYTAKLRGSSLYGANLQGVGFGDADLSNADLEYSNLYAATLNREQLESSQFVELIGIEDSGDSSCAPKDRASTSWDVVNTSEAIGEANQRLRASFPLALTSSVPELAEFLNKNDPFDLSHLEAARQDKTKPIAADILRELSLAPRFKTMSEKQQIALSEDLRRVACSSEWGPHVARGLIYNQRILELGSFMKNIGDAFSDPSKCAGASKLTSEDFQKLACLMKLKSHTYYNAVPEQESTPSPSKG